MDQNERECRAAIACEIIEAVIIDVVNIRGGDVGGNMMGA